MPSTPKTIANPSRSRWPVISSVGSFVTELLKLPVPPGGLISYRGERNDTWHPEPGLMRAGRAKLLENERDAVRELIALRPSDFLYDTSMFDRLVRMQHFGLPTRLLDVTANPFVALYNAVKPSTSNAVTDGRVMAFAIEKGSKKYFDSDTISIISNLANLSAAEKLEIDANIDVENAAFNKLKSVDRLLQLIRAEKPYFRPEIIPGDLERYWFVTPKLSNSRIIAQQGAFLIFGINNNKTSIKFGSFLVPAAHKTEVLQQLDALGINESGLFPEIESAARHIAMRLNR